MKIKEYQEIYGLWDRGFKQREIARILKLSQSTVSEALKELKSNCPQLFPKHQGAPKVQQYDPLMDKYVKQKV